MSLDLYAKLVKVEAKHRQSAACHLLNDLTIDGAQGLEISADQQYAVKRLVRGLSSPTEAARQGFAACLAELLSRLPQLPLSLILDHMEASTEVTGSLKGHEERNLFLGRLFTCLAIARSGRLEAAEADWSIGLKFLETASQIFRTRRKLRTLATQALSSFLTCLPPAFFLQIPYLLPFVFCLTTSSNDASNLTFLPLANLNPDQLSLAFSLHSYLRKHHLLSAPTSTLISHLPSYVLSKRLFNPSDLSDLIEPLKASSESFPQIHPVWDDLLEYCLARKRDMLPVLWSAVDEILATGTQQRKALALLLLQSYSPRLPAPYLTILLSPHLLKLLLNSLSTSPSSDSNLASLARQTLQLLTDLAKHDAAKGQAILTALLRRCGPHFDQRTHTSTMNDMLASLAVSELKEVLGMLGHETSKEGDGEVVEVLYVIGKVGVGRQKDGEELVGSVLGRLFALSYGREGENAGQIREAAAGRFWKLLREVGGALGWEMLWERPEGRKGWLMWLWDVCMTCEKGREGGGRTGWMSLVERVKGAGEGKVSRALAGLVMWLVLEEVESERRGGSEGERGQACARLEACWEACEAGAEVGVEGFTDVCIDLLAGENGGKGRREVVRKAALCVFAELPVGRGCVDRLLDAVLGEMREGASEDGDEENSSKGTGGEDEDVEASEEEEEDENSEVPIQEDDEEGSSEGPLGAGADEGEVVLSGEQGLMEVLGEEGEGGGAFEHMMAMRRELRPGTRLDRVEREREDLVGRLRVVDLLEILVGKQPGCVWLLLTLLPIGKLVRRLEGRGEEARALGKRLSDLVVRKMQAKVKIKAEAGGGLSLGGEMEEVVLGLCAELRRASHAPQVALLTSALTICIRVILSTSTPHASIPTYLTTAYSTLITDFVGKKGRLTPYPFEQLITRFPSAASVILLPALVRVLPEGKGEWAVVEGWRLVGLLYQRKKSLDKVAREVLSRELSGVLEGLKGLLRRQGIGAKRLRVVLGIMGIVVAEGGEERRGLSGVLGEVGSKSESQVIRRMCEQLVRRIEGKKEGKEEKKGGAGESHMQNGHSLQPGGLSGSRMGGKEVLPHDGQRKGKGRKRDRALEGKGEKEEQSYEYGRVGATLDDGEGGIEQKKRQHKGKKTKKMDASDGVGGLVEDSHAGAAVTKSPGNAGDASQPKGKKRKKNKTSTDIKGAVEDSHAELRSTGKDGAAAQASQHQVKHKRIQRRERKDRLIQNGHADIAMKGQNMHAPTAKLGTE